MAHIPFVPGDVPPAAREKFIQNYNRITKNTNRLFLFVVDHKLEHLNDDFQNLDPNLQNPVHFFRIA